MITKLQDICDFLSGNAWKASKFEDAGIPIIRIANMNELESDFVYWQESYDKKYLINQGDLLVSLSGSIKVHKWDGPEALLNQRIVKITTDRKDVNIDWVYYQLVYAIEIIANKGKHAVIKNVSVNELKKFEVDLPDIQTQNKIVDVLDRASSLVKRRELTIKLFDELLRATFLDMFGDPISNNRSWEIKLLGEIAKLERGRFSPRPRNDPSYFNGEYPFIQTGDINISDYRLREYTQTLNEKGIKVSKEFNVGDIVIAIVGATIGATSILQINAYATDSIIAIKSQEKTNNVFLEMLMRFYRQVLLDTAPSAARANINLSILNKLKIIIPPIELQDKYLEIDKKIEQSKNKLFSSLNEIKALKNSLTQKVFSGELNFNIDFELDALVREVDLDKKQNDLSKIGGDIAYLQRLVDKLNTQEFDEKEMYDKAKHAAFQLLKEGKKITQEHDEHSNNVKLVLK